MLLAWRNLDNKIKLCFFRNDAKLENLLHSALCHFQCLYITPIRNLSACIGLYIYGDTIIRVFVKCCNSDSYQGLSVYTGEFINI